MKLIKCPPGITGFRDGKLSYYVERVLPEERGYTVVPDELAEKLCTKSGYEMVAISNYPRDIEKLKRTVQTRLATSGIFHTQDTTPKKLKPSISPLVPAKPVTKLPLFITPATSLETETQSKDSYTLSADFRESCVFCNFRAYMRRLFRRPQKVKLRAD